MKDKEKNEIIDVLYAASGIAVALFTIPQIIKVWITHTQHIDGMSLITWVGYLLAAVIGLVYGIIRKEPAIITTYGLSVISTTAVNIGIIFQTRSFW